VQWHARDPEAGFNGAIWALAQAGGLGAKVTGMADGTDLETTEPDIGCGQVPRTVRLEEPQSRVHEVEGTVYGGNGLLLSDAVTKIPLAVKVGTMQDHEVLWPDFDSYKYI
jgi:hypothetical protein